MACKCIKEQVGQGSGTVKGWVTTVECAECKAQRELDSINNQIAEAENKLRAEKEALIQSKIRELAEAELKKEGKL